MLNFSPKVVSKVSSLTNYQSEELNILFFILFCVSSVLLFVLCESAAMKACISIWNLSVDVSLTFVS